MIEAEKSYSVIYSEIDNLTYYNSVWIVANQLCTLRNYIFIVLSTCYILSASPWNFATLQNSKSIPSLIGKWQKKFYYNTL